MRSCGPRVQESGVFRASRVRPRLLPSPTIREKRKLLHGLLDRVVLKKAGFRGRLAPSIENRVQIVLRGNVLLGTNPD
jgi:hypothetical protein